MIICVTPNVAVDRTYLLPTVRLGQVLRATRTITVAGGKGLNVARAIKTLGEEALVMGLVGGRSGELVAELAAQEGLTAQWTWAASETRNCAILVSEEGAPATVVNDRGGPVSTTEWLQFIHDVAEAAPLASAVCICGSLPPGAPAHAPSDLVEAVLAAGVPVWVDASGPALAQAVSAYPTGIKINDEEAGALLGRTLTYLDDLHGAAQALHTRGIDQVIITLGARGAIYCAGRRQLHLRAPALTPVSATGSGDAFLAGWLVAQSRGLDAAAALTWGIAAGAANALSAGGGIFPRRDFDHFLAQLLDE